MSYKSFSEIIVGRPRPKVFLILKIGQKEHLEQLQSGKIRFRKLSFYSSMESKGKSFFDENEGLESVLQADQVTLEIGPKGKPKFKISAENGLVGQMLVKINSDSPVFCLHAMHTGDWTHRQFSEQEIPLFKEHIRVPPTLRKFGNWIWYLRDADEFQRRISSAVKSLGIGLSANLVEYVSFLEMHGKVGREHRYFVKSREYAEEREYRIRLDSQKPFVDPYILDVGNLKDISEIVSFDEFENSWDIGFQKD